MPGTPLTNPVGKIFQALACDLRLRVLDGINRGYVTTDRLARHLDLQTSTVRKATGPLAAAGLIERTPQDAWRTRHEGAHILAVTPLARDLVARVLREPELLAALRSEGSEQAA